MKLHELSPAEGAVQERKRKGRGIGTGNGKTAGKGHKGQKALMGIRSKLAQRLAQQPNTNCFLKCSEERRQ